MTIVWKQHTKKYYSNYEECYLGKINVACVNFNNLKSRNDVGKDYSYTVLLPGFILSSGTASTIEEAKQIVEKKIAIWLEAIKD